MARRLSAGRRPLRAPQLLAGPQFAAGFTYIGLLIAIVLMGVALSAVGTIWRTTAVHEREKELLYIGHTYQAAIGAYYNQGRQFPQELEDLVEDKRWPVPRHYLRHLYPDPMTGEVDWVLIRGDAVSGGAGGITGIASKSMLKPLKKAGFLPTEESFGDAETYQDWKFLYVPRIGSHRPVLLPPVTENPTP
jgi:type II secretory pathway pseudopilin PulG